MMSDISLATTKVSFGVAASAVAELRERQRRGHRRQEGKVSTFQHCPVLPVPVCVLGANRSPDDKVLSLRAWAAGPLRRSVAIAPSRSRSNPTGASIASEASRTARSANFGPTTYKPTDGPSAVRPRGSHATDRPMRLNGSVQGMASRQRS